MWLFFGSNKNISNVPIYVIYLYIHKHLPIYSHKTMKFVCKHFLTFVRQALPPQQ